ncbi:MAG: DnaA regulatory inactivator HdaA [Rhizobiaceae bacterium]|nr:DnaA regulatory inactivator HdaA [Rhizobiaceae bacterium]
MSSSSEPQQLPLDLAAKPAFSRDDLVVTQANSEAVRLVDGWPDWPGPVVVLAGPAGSGKSHLAEIWRSRSGASPLDASAIETRLPQLREAGPWLVDDVDSGSLDQTGLFHLINLARQQHSHILLTARRFPGAWGVELPDLASRLKAATVVEIHEPDDALLAGVISKLFADRQIEVEPHTVAYIVRRIERSLAAAINVVNRLDYAALSQNTRITRALAADVITSLDEGQAELPL